MKNNTRIYNKFEYWSVEDCDCKYCLHHSKKKGCKLKLRFNKDVFNFGDLP
ncbi:hypothetical protein AALB39_26655 [Lachnospiraceae bacterium 54-53]